MKVIKATQQMLETRTLVLGFQGENLRTQLRIDCASTFAEYPNATPALAIKPPTGETYPVFVNRDGTEVVWDIVANNLALKGDGELQLTFYKGDVIAKTYVGHIRVNRSLQIDGDMPDVVATWIENANRKLAEVDAQIVELEGMVDTATDAAERAEQSASTASTKAEQAAGSAATASTKAAEAQASANTATAKASEAALSATQASNSAVSAADSERGAMAKAEQAAQSALSASTDATLATEAAQTATAKAGEASASAQSARASATDAASSATAASASETAAKASETAAGASATQASISEQNAGTAAQTATQKAAEATQSATDAQTFAGTATTKAEEAATSAQAASDAKTAVEQTAEQLADSLEQIEQNTQDIAELDERKANIDGYYPDMTVGNAEQLNSSKFVENSEPYTLRTSGGTSDIGNREYLDAVVGGTLAWNQAVRDEASENSTDFADVVTVTDAVEDAAGVKVKIEPVQDLHGYDHPWPAGGGKNKFCDVFSEYTRPYDYYTLPITLAEGTYRLWASKTKDTVTGCAVGIAKSGNRYTDFDGLVLIMTTSGSVNSTVLTVDSTWTDPKLCIYCSGEAAFNSIFENYRVQLESGAIVTDYEPYSNICPITGWNQAKVTRTGKNLFNAHNWSFDSSQPYNRFVVKSDNSIQLQTLAHLEKFNRYDLPPQFKTISFHISTLEISDSKASIKLHFYKSDGTVASQNTFYLTETGYEQEISLPIPSTAVYMCFGNWAYQGKILVYDIQLELSSTATAYEPYAGQVYDITLPTEAGTVYGGELTVNADGSGSLIVDRKVIVFDGSDNYAWSYLPNYHCMVCGNGISDIEYGVKISDYQNSYGIVVHRTAITLKQLQFGSSSSPIEGVASSVEEWKSKLNENPIQVVYPLATPITYTLTASQIRTLLGQNNVWADTGDIALTYTGTDEHLTLESGKKYLARLSGTDSMLLGSGQEITAVKGTDNVFDLTQMFGAAVADYVYGQGAGFFRKWFPGARYPYNAGELLSVEGLQSHDMVGFNQWDEEWEVGGYNVNGKAATTLAIRNKNPVRIIPGAQYYFKRPNSIAVYAYGYSDENYSNGRSITIYATPFTFPEGVNYIGWQVSKSAYGSETYNHDICISLAHNGSRNGEYEPYEKHSYPLDSSVILRGIPKVGSNGVYWDGDRYLPDGTVERRYGVVDLGTLDWAKYGSTFYANVAGLKPTGSTLAMGNIMCPKYTNVPVYQVTGTYPYDKIIAANEAQGRVNARDSLYAESTASEFRDSLSGVYLVYELATPTTETAQPYHSTQWVSDWGTEEFVSTGLVPVGSETRYPANLRDKLQHLPDAASGNGSYLITQTDGQMVLTPFPAPPSMAGNYVLKATVTGGVATYTWEVAT